jgi:hypothetical protein
MKRWAGATLVAPALSPIQPRRVGVRPLRQSARAGSFILEQGETVEYVSLGAGNTGREFDLETNLRVAEFKFIRWRGGAESIRQNSIFKDYVLLAENPTPKRKYLYLVGTEHALKFLHGGRALSSVLSRNDKLQKMFSERFGSQFSKVRDYYELTAMRCRSRTCQLGSRSWRRC